MNSAEGDRAAFRRWARQNHPDVGGDPDRFAQAVRAFHEGRWDEFVGQGPAFDEGRIRPTVYVKRRSRGFRGLVSKVSNVTNRNRRHPRVQ